MRRVNTRNLVAIGLVAVAAMLATAGNTYANGVGSDTSVVHVSFPAPGPLPTGTFDTEMLSLNLTSVAPLMIRESPTKASLGRTQITGTPGGLYHIDSFFDVFTELSVDGGQTWTPSGGSADLRLRESPTLQSHGNTQLTGPPGGPYHIDSFFDIFTELSLDGGQTWTPAAGTGRMTGQGPTVPLPPAVWAGAMMLAGVVLKRGLATKA